MKDKQLRIGGGLFIILAVFLQITNSYHLFYLEQLQLFLFDHDYIAEHLWQVGGFTSLAGEFLTQFFIKPYVGALITAALLTAIGLSTRGIYRRIKPRQELCLLYLLPVLSLLLIQYDFNYRLQGSIAFLCMSLTFNGWIRIRTYACRISAALILTPILFGLAGSVALLFAASITLLELIHHRKRGLWSLFMLVEIVLIVMGSQYGLWVGDPRFAILPDAYYHPNLSAPAILYSSWISWLAGLILASRWPAKLRTISPGRPWGIAIQLMLFLGISYYAIPRYSDQKSYQMKTLDYLARTHQWEEIIRKSQGRITNYLYLNYLNLALAENGQLADRMFAFDQHGPYGLLLNWNKTAHVSTLLSDIYFSMGEIALSQEMAFEANVTAGGAGNPRNLQRLVQTNLIFGHYPIAEKYIDLLEKSYAYREWARQQRPLLYNDAAIEADALLGGKRKGLPKENRLAGIQGLDHDLLKRAESTLGDQQAMQYAGIFYLLSKNIKAFQAMIERFYGTASLPSLPISFQEAVILLAEQDIDYWERFHLSESVIQRFASYRSLIIQQRNNPQLPRMIQQSFGDTYWAYYLLKK